MTKKDIYNAQSKAESMFSWTIQFSFFITFLITCCVAIGFITPAYKTGFITPAYNTGFTEKHPPFL